MRKFLTILKITVAIIAMSPVALMPTEAYGQAKVNISSKTKVVHTTTYYVHTVKRKHTLYSIAKAYGVEQKIIEQSNPTVNFNPLRTRTKLLIPMPKLNSDGNYSFEKVEGNEVISNNKELLTAAELETEAKILANSSGFIAADSIFLARENQINFQVGTEIKCAIALPFNAQTHINWIEFVQGAEFARTALAHKGVKLKIIKVPVHENEFGFFDVDTIALKDVDIIIGPVHDKTYEYVARWANKVGIPIIAPFTSLDKTTPRPYSVQIAPTDNTKYSKVASWLADANNNVILINHTTYGDSSAMAEISPYLPRSTKNITYSRVTPAKTHILPLLDRTRTNVFVVPVSHYGSIEDILSKITSVNSPYKKYDIQVLGTSRWRTASNNVNPELFFNSNTRFISSYYADRAVPEVAQFYADYITRYGKLPTLFAMRSYDIVMIMAGALNNAGGKALSSLANESQQYKPLMTPYKFNLDEQGQIVNSQWPLVIYKDDYTVKCQ